MLILDFILNLAGLLLWINWRALSFPEPTAPGRISILRTLRRAEPRRLRKWAHPLGLLALLFGRAWLYQQLGSALGWTAPLHLGVVAVPFRSDFVGQMWLFSLLGFGRFLLVFHLWLLVLSMVNRGAEDDTGLLRLVRQHLGWLDRWPMALKLVVPTLVVMAGWMLLQPLITKLGLMPASAGAGRTLLQGALIGVAAWISCQYLLLFILGAHLVNSYVFLGQWPLWPFVDLTARRLLAPLRRLPLIVGRVDFAPLLVWILVLVVARYGLLGLGELYHGLP